MFDEDFLVLELAAILAGPTVGMFLAELGARVIKVENPHTGGDATRGWKLSSEPAESSLSSYFVSANWGKESIVIDLTTEAGLEVVHDLVRRADVVIASFKPGDDVRLKLDYESLRRHRPDLIYAQISAYGDADPRPGFDAILQAESGFTYLNGEPDGPPTKMPVALVDILLAHQLKEGVLLALLKRERSGEGSLVTASLLQCAVASLANQATNYLVGGVVPQRLGSEHPNIAPYGTILRCADDRELVIAAATERQYRGLMGALGLAAFAEEERFAIGQQRVIHRDALLDLIRPAAARLDSGELAAALLEAKVPFGFVNDMQAVFEQPQAEEAVLTGTREGRTLRAVRTAVFGGDAATLVEPAAPPALGEHQQTVLADLLGYSADRVGSLRAAGAFGDQPP